MLRGGKTSYTRGSFLRLLSTHLLFTLSTGAIQFATALLLPYYLSPDEYGRLGIFLSLLYFTTPMISLAAEGLIPVVRAQMKASEYSKFMSSYLALSYIIFGALIAGACFASYSVANVGWFVGLVPVYALIKFVVVFANYDFVMQEQAKRYGLYNFGSAILCLAFTYLAFTSISATTEARIMSLIAADAVFVAIRYWGNLSVLVQPTIDKTQFKSIIYYGLPSLVAVAGAWALNESDKILIVRFVGLEEAGVYTAAATLCAVMMTLFMALTNSIMPRLFGELEEVDGVKNRLLVIRRYVLYFIVPSVFFCIVMILFMNYFSALVLPERYSRSLYIFNAMAPLMLTIAFYRPLGLCLEYYKLSVFRMWSISGAGILTLATTYICIHIFGYQWAVLGSASGYLFLTATTWHKLRRYKL